MCESVSKSKINFNVDMYTTTLQLPPEACPEVHSFQLHSVLKEQKQQRLIGGLFLLINIKVKRICDSI